MALEENNNQALLNIAKRSIDIAVEHSHEITTLEHLLVSLLETEDVQNCFTALKIDFKPVLDLMDTFLDSDFIAKTDIQGPPPHSLHFEELMHRVLTTAMFSGRRSPLGPNDVLLQLMQVPHEDNYAVTALLNSGLTTLAMKRYLSHGGSGKQEAATAKGVLAPDGSMVQADVDPTTHDEALAILGKYCVDLNAQATSGKVDPLIGRADVIDQITLIVSRRSKNNAVLVGDPGVGKTAIAEGLAYKIVKGDVPAVLMTSTVYSLDIASLVAGTRFRGDFEERMKLVLKSLTMIENSILFIDEIHTIMGAGAGSNSTMDVANLLKPALAKGSLRCIGSTTAEEYRKHFEKDRALLRRFKKVVVGEPSIEEAKLILRGLKSTYEKFHGVKYSVSALDAAVDLTARYIHNAVLPDKAIDIMDNAGARKRVLNYDTGLPPVTITVADIEAEIALVAKIPAKEIAEDESHMLSRLENDLKDKVFGQDGALTTLIDAVFVARAGLRDENKPEGCYLMVGNSGTGKTETCRQLAKTLNIPLVKFDMSEFMEKHSISKLIGSPPGYVGFGDGGAGDGLLVNAIDTSPSCVLLLDEIEKAHPDVFNILLQVMDDAKLTNSHGKSVDFRNVILIMTSNAGSGGSEKMSIGFSNNTNSEIDTKVLKALFTPEFRNRLDAVITFDRLKPDSMAKIVEKFISELKILTGRRNVKIDINKKALTWLAEKGYDPAMGARPLNRVINEHIKKPLSRLMLVGSMKDTTVSHTAIIRLVDDALTISCKADLKAEAAIEQPKLEEVTG